MINEIININNTVLKGIVLFTLVQSAQHVHDDLCKMPNSPSNAYIKHRDCNTYKDYLGAEY